MNWSKKIGMAVVVLVLVGGTGWLEAGGFLLKKEDIPKAVAKLQSGTPQEKVDAAEALGRRGAVRATDVKDAVDPLKDMLVKDKDAKVRAAAAKALGNIAPEPKETVQLLLKALQTDKDTDVKVAAMRAISQMPSAAGPAIPEIQKYAKDKTQRQLFQAARLALKQLRAK
jgi:HEAT repeat protein